MQFFSGNFTEPLTPCKVSRLTNESLSFLRLVLLCFKWEKYFFLQANFFFIFPSTTVFFSRNIFTCSQTTVVSYFSPSCCTFFHFSPDIVCCFSSRYWVFFISLDTNFFLIFDRHLLFFIFPLTMTVFLLLPRQRLFLISLQAATIYLYLF